MTHLPTESQLDKYVGITWFVGASKTRHLSLSKRNFRTGLILVGALFFFLLVSIPVNSHLWRSRWQIAGQLKSAKKVIWDLEVKHARLYETTYDAHPALLATEQLEDKEAPLSLHQPTQPTATPQKTSKDAAFAKMRIKRLDSSLQIYFELHNRSKKKVIEGKLWALILYHHSGRNQVGSFPSNLETEFATLKPLNPKLGDSFKVRNFKYGELKVELPTDAHVLLVRVGAVDKSGELLDSYFDFGRHSSIQDEVAKSLPLESGFVNSAKS